MTLDASVRAQRVKSIAAVGMVAAILDIWSKQTALSWLADFPFGFAVMPFFNLRLSFNPGISFGFFAADSTSAVSALVIAAITLILVVVWIGFHSKSAMEVIASGLIAVGAIDNILDRADDDLVTDFLDIHALGRHWPTFNLADFAITTGVVLLLLAAARSARHSGTCNTG